MSSISEKSAFEAFARMEEKIDQNERQLRAAQEIDEEFTRTGAIVTIGTPQPEPAAKGE